MPCTPAATKVFQDRGIMYGPGKAVNAGGVAVSGLEMSQDRIGLQWSREEVGGWRGAGQSRVLADRPHRAAAEPGMCVARSPTLHSTSGCRWYRWMPSCVAS